MQKTFSPFGSIQEIRVFKDKGYAFIRYVLHAFCPPLPPFALIQPIKCAPTLKEVIALRLREARSNVKSRARARMRFFTEMGWFGMYRVEVKSEREGN